MSDDPSPSGKSLLAEQKDSDPNAIRDLEARVSQLAEKIEADGLGWEADYKKKLLLEVEQRMNLRFAVMVMAAFVLCVMGLFAWGAYGHLTTPQERAILGNGAKIGIFVAPIVSITTVTVMMLVGAFRRSKDEDQDKIDIPALTLEAYKAAHK